MHCVAPSFSLGINVLVTEMTGTNVLLGLLIDNDLEQTIPCSESLVVPGKNCHHYSKQNYLLKLQSDISINCIKYNH